MALLAAGAIKADFLTSLAEEELFADPVVYARTTPYQRIVVTSAPSGFQLFLNGNLQFSSADEYRYHEALVHPAMMAAASPRSALILGGGDGLALREVLKHASIEDVTLVDIDPGMTELSSKFPPLAALNQNAFADGRVHVVTEDAMIWLEKPGPPADVAIVDFPDPNSFALGKLYTTRFYRLLRARLSPRGAIGLQATSPLFARHSFWCIVRTMEAAGFAVKPYQAAVPSFGVWGFILAKAGDFEAPARSPVGLRFLNDQTLASLFVLPADAGPVPAEVNRLDNQVLVRYYEAEWRRWE
jgi:spermidine synthase